MNVSHNGSWPIAALYRPLRWLCVLAAIAAVVVFATAGYNGGRVYYFGIAFAAVPIALYAMLGRLTQRYRMRQKARERWARPPRGDMKIDRKMQQVYLDAVATGEEALIDGQTWSDLDLDDITAEMDVCYSAAGRNGLFALLHRCLPNDGAFRWNTNLIGRLRDDERFRLALLSEIAVLDSSVDDDPLPLLFGETHSVDRLYPLYIALSVSMAAAIASPFLIGAAPGALCIFIVFLTNMWIYHRRARDVTDRIPMLRGLFRLVVQASRIVRIDFKEDDGDLDEVRAAVRDTAGMGRAFRSVLAGSSSGSVSAAGDIVETLTLYLKVLFLVDLIAFNRVAERIRKNLPALRTLYSFVGRLDALQSAASFIAMHEPPGRPVFDGRDHLVVRSIYHPAIDEAVANSIDLELPGAVVTGTNMAGKSTFLRTLGVNAVLAQTLGVCFADAYRGGRFLVMSSIDKRDDLEGGKSFYYAEAERIFRMIERVGGEHRVLLLIDELLAGTNSLERESASVAILEYLARNRALTVAATHDITIARRVADSYQLFYFTDHAGAGGLSFDYKIRRGIVSTRNAIKLLSIIGYPKDLIERALSGANGGSS